MKLWSKYQAASYLKFRCGTCRGLSVRRGCPLLAASEQGLELPETRSKGAWRLPRDAQD